MIGEWGGQREGGMGYWVCNHHHAYRKFSKIFYDCKSLNDIGNVVWLPLFYFTLIDSYLLELGNISTLSLTPPQETNKYAFHIFVNLGFLISIIMLFISAFIPFPITNHFSVKYFNYLENVLLPPWD